MTTRRAYIPARTLILLGMAILLAGFGWILGERAAKAAPGALEDAANTFHPPVALLDEDGVNVLESGKPVSTMQTCGACHDTAFIATHAFHADTGLSLLSRGESGSQDHPWDQSTGFFGDWEPIAYRYLSPLEDARIDLTTPEWLMLFGARHVGGGPAVWSRSGLPLTDLTPGASAESLIHDPDTGELVPWDWASSGVIEMNCFLCHIPDPDTVLRQEAIRSGEFRWANTATLGRTGVVIPEGDGYAYAVELFTPQGELPPEVLDIGDPSNENCGTCHWTVHTEVDIPMNDPNPDVWWASETGQVISPQRLKDSGLNLANKDALSRTWDVHAERLVNCVDCHFSINNPVHQDPEPGEDLAHLIYDPRRIDLSAYLQQPDHNLARGPHSRLEVAPELAGSMRRCESCHDGAKAHAWLPYTERHLEAVSCETCHIPELYAPAYEQVDWTVIRETSQPRISYRGVEDALSSNPLLTGYRPVLLPSTDVDGRTSLAPFNLVGIWYWVYDMDGEMRPVPLNALESAWLENGVYAEEVVSQFDANGDGILSDDELILDSQEKVRLIANRLESGGLENPRIQAEVQPYPIYHGVVEGEAALNTCSTCHGEDSALSAAMSLGDGLPGGVLPEDAAAGPLAGGNIHMDDQGRLTYVPDPSRQGLYILGQDRVGWVDGLGIVVFVGVLIGVGGHAGFRVAATRKRAEAETQVELKKEYMYSVYERMWHWLQTGAILILLFTGLVIHKPGTFGGFSFHHVVLVHNVVAGVLVANAALALFYHLVSGEIQQYLPRPRGFFNTAIVQARYYLQGIFKGEPHPFEKTPQHKLNPLQQVTYFGILNVLLPLQILTGALMWGAQRWPQLADRLGGLPFLGPFHSLIAWLFAAFILAHVYLTTTGPYPTAGIKAMMFGWDEIEVHQQPPVSAETSAAD